MGTEACIFMVNLFLLPLEKGNLVQWTDKNASLSLSSLFLVILCLYKQERQKRRGLGVIDIRQELSMGSLFDC